MQSVTIGKNQAGQRLDKFLHKYMPEAGNGFLYKMLRKKNITLNGKKAEGSEILKPEDTVSFFFSDETFQKFTGRPLTPGKGTSGAAGAGKAAVSASVEMYRRAYRAFPEIKVIYEDDNILIADKPAGILSQKAEASDLSLNEWLIGRLLEREPRLEQELDTFRPSVCNRLDRNTSGLVLCGKSLAGSQLLSQYIRERRVRKFYRTVCAGEMTEPITARGYLEKDSAGNKVTFREKPSGNVRESAIETAYRPLGSAGGYTLLEVELITGKPHQIRAHLAGLGHPVIGDCKYGSERVNRRFRESFQLTCQLLHACRVVFPYCDQGPGAAVSGREFRAPYPEGFMRVLEGLKLDGSGSAAPD